MNAFSPLGCIALAMSFASVVVASESPCARCAAPTAPRVEQVCIAEDDEQPSWIFRRSTYTHDPNTGARVAQYQRLPAIEPLEDERLVTSRYHRTQTNLRGTNGSSESYYDVQAWGNGRGGIDAEWERFHNAWKESYLQGGFYNHRDQASATVTRANLETAASAGPAYGYGYPGYGFPGNGFPGIGNGGPLGKPRRGLECNGNGHHGNGGTIQWPRPRRAIGTDRRSDKIASTQRPTAAVPVLLRRVAFNEPAVVAQDPLQDEVVLGAAFHAVLLVDRENHAAAFHSGSSWIRSAFQSISGVPMIRARSICTSGISVSTSLRSCASADGAR